jgi:hypothetical protein
MKNVGRDVVALKRQAQKSYAEMKKARGQVARYCLEDANFYMAPAIKIAGAAGHNGMVARLARQRDHLVHANVETKTRSPQPDAAGIERWENEGGALRT